MVVAGAPLASLGPRIEDRLASSPWRRGRLLVDEDDRPIAADSLEVGGTVTAFPQGADKRALGVYDKFERGVYRLADASR